MNFSTLVIPAILSVSWTDYTSAKFLFLAALVFIHRSHLTNPFSNPRPTYSPSDSSQYYIFLTFYRALLMLATCISILAVDFPLYPRRFVKTEVKGVSLMDIGTGSVVFASALVARHARGRQSAWLRVRSAFFSCLPLWVIGTGKLWLHTAVDYQLHVSEYGVHWNFFMSVGAVTLMSAVVSLPAWGRIGLAGVIIALYEVFLRNGFENYMFHAERNNLFSMNREGIVGCIGFFCIYQFGLGLKEVMLKPGKEFKYMCIAFVAFGGLSWAIGDESRRLVRNRQNNAGYVFWTIAHNLIGLISVWIVERSLKQEVQNTVLEAISFNQIGYFMICNLLTGAVNFAMQTVFTQDGYAFCVLVLYQLLACWVMWLLKLNGVRIKKW
jgi:glucosaminylphosphatidylinositol acyltransferase